MNAYRLLMWPKGRKALLELYFVSPNYKSRTLTYMKIYSVMQYQQLSSAMPEPMPMSKVP